MNPHETGDLSPQTMRPVEVSSWVLGLFGLMAAWWLPVEQSVRLASMVCMVGFLLYVVVYFHWLNLRPNNPAWIPLLPTYANIAMVSALDYLIGATVNIEVLFIVIIVNAAIRLGRRHSMLAGSISAMAIVAIDVLRSEPVYASGWISTVLVALVVVIAGYLAGTLADTIRRQREQVAHRNRNLGLLLEVSTAGSSSLELAATLPRLAEMIARGLPVTLCRICLLNAESQCLVNAGAFPLRLFAATAPDTGHRWHLEDLPLHRQAIESGRMLFIRQSDPNGAMGQAERAALLFDGIKLAYLVPLVFEGRRMGIISLGEARSPERERFDEGKQNLIGAIAAQAATLMNNARLHQAIQRQADRMSALNEVARAVGSTLEMDQMLGKIYQQLKRIIPTDTYYVGLREPSSDFIDLQIVFDDGVNFPPRKIRYGEGLASLVIQRREPLLIRRLSVEGAALPIRPVLVGDARISESWLGVPLVLSDEFTGLLAVASYQPNAFNDEDVALLSNVAGQVALALDNARHHAQVEARAREDSLTGVFNHGYLLERLHSAFEHARGSAGSVSFIMLDIDHFKRYNDLYGHVMGDRVLRLIVQAVRAHVKQTDAVGRWGGEEFGIVLPDSTMEQAHGVAVRIRETLAGLPLVDDTGQPIPKPTVSQGIATFPDDVLHAGELVDLADAMLYKAKQDGRDQVRVAAQARATP